MTIDGFIPPHGGYRNLHSYRKAEIVYDATVCFCERFIDRRSRTLDQMIQAARSGKQNIIERSMASGTSKMTGIKLTNVARASMEELLADYHDFLRVRGLKLWPKESKEALFVRRLGAKEKESAFPKNDGAQGTHRTHDSHSSHPSYQSQEESYDTYRPFLETRPAEVVANIIICLIHQANYLLDRQLKQLEQAFIKEGGLRERMTQARLAHRGKSHR